LTLLPLASVILVRLLSNPTEQVNMSVDTIVHLPAASNIPACVYIASYMATVKQFLYAAVLNTPRAI